MTDVKPLDMFQDECEDNQEIAVDEASDLHEDYCFNDPSDDEREDPDDLNRVLDPETIQRQQNDILYSIQGVGSIQNINNYDVYVKSKYCEASLKEISRYLKLDNESHPTSKLILGEWKFL